MLPEKSVFPLESLRFSSLRKRIAACVCAAFFLTFSQEVATGQPPPVAVLNLHSSKYAGSETLDWENINGRYKAAFFLPSGNYAEAIYEPSGKWLHTAIQIVENQLPAKAQTCWKKKYPDIRSVSSLVQKDAPDGTKYLVSFETATALVNLTFNEKGRLVKKMSEPISLDE